LRFRRRVELRLNYSSVITRGVELCGASDFLAGLQEMDKRLRNNGSWHSIWVPVRSSESN
jgi:hypothetical protein